MITNLLKLVIGLTALASSALAELKWEQTSTDLHPAIGDKQAVAHFKYENVGQTPVRFKSVHASCGCTVAQTQKEVVAPGEKGEVTATFNIGDRTGTQIKTVTVQTDDPDPQHANIVLTLKATIPQAIEVQPTFVYWENSEAPNPKTIAVKTAKELNAKSLNVTSSSADFTAKVTSNGANEFKIEITPRDTNHVVNATLTILPDSGGKPVYATARVVNPKT